MTSEIFKDFFQSAIVELVGETFDAKQYIFEVIADIKESRHYTSKDEYNLHIFKKYTETPLRYRYEEIMPILLLFSKYDRLYPISIELSLKAENEKVICLRLDPRYRKLKELKNQDTGHPPFKVVR